MSREPTPKPATPTPTQAPLPLDVKTPPVKDVRKALFEKIKKHNINLLTTDREVIEEILESEENNLHKKIKELTAEIYELGVLSAETRSRWSDEKEVETSLKAVKEWLQEYSKTRSYYQYLINAPKNFRKCEEQLSTMEYEDSEIKNDLLPSTRNNPVFITAMSKILEAVLKDHSDKLIIFARRAVYCEWLALKDSEKEQCLDSQISFAKLILSQALNQFSWVQIQPKGWQSKYPAINNTKKLLDRYLINFGFGDKASIQAGRILRELESPSTATKTNESKKVAENPFYDYLWNILNMGDGLDQLCEKIFFNPPTNNDYNVRLGIIFGVEESKYFNFKPEVSLVSSALEVQTHEIQRSLNQYVTQIKQKAESTKWPETHAFYRQINYILTNYKFDDFPHHNVVDIHKAIVWLCERIRVDCALNDLSVVCNSKNDAKPLAPTNHDAMYQFEKYKNLDMALNGVTQENLNVHTNLQVTQEMIEIINLAASKTLGVLIENGTAASESKLKSKHKTLAERLKEQQRLLLALEKSFETGPKLLMEIRRVKQKVSEDKVYENIRSLTPPVVRVPKDPQDKSRVLAQEIIERLEQEMEKEKEMEKEMENKAALVAKLPSTTQVSTNPAAISKTLETAAELKESLNAITTGSSPIKPRVKTPSKESQDPMLNLQAPTGKRPKGAGAFREMISGFKQVNQKNKTSAQSALPLQEKDPRSLSPLLKTAEELREELLAGIGSSASSGASSTASSLESTSVESETTKSKSLGVSPEISPSKTQNTTLLTPVSLFGSLSSAPITEDSLVTKLTEFVSRFGGTPNS